jgi:predicted transcriptional regulator
MKSKQSILSPLEWEIMDVIWNHNKQISVREVLKSRYPSGEKAYTTVQTVMNNLEKKGFLTTQKIGMVNFYQPLYKRINAVQNETSRFVKRVYN